MGNSWNNGQKSPLNTLPREKRWIALPSLLQLSTCIFERRDKLLQPTSTFLSAHSITLYVHGPRDSTLLSDFSSFKGRGPKIWCPHEKGKGKRKRRHDKGGCVNFVVLISSTCRQGEGVKKLENFWKSLMEDPKWFLIIWGNVFCLQNVIFLHVRYYTVYVLCQEPRKFTHCTVHSNTEKL